MAGQIRERIISIIGVILVVVTGCAETSDMAQRALGRDIAAYRKNTSTEEFQCPTITSFNVSPVMVQCGAPISLELVAVAPAPNGEELSYTWEIAGRSFETGHRAVWNTPTCKTISDPEKVYTVRGIVSDGECAVTRSVDVKVFCNCAFDAMLHFAFGKAELDPTARIGLDNLGKMLQQNQKHFVLIEGHTDYIGSDQYNKLLGKRRAEAVKEYLVTHWNINPDRLITRSLGEEEPIAPNESPAGRAENRRTEIFRILLTSQQSFEL